MHESVLSRTKTNISTKRQKLTNISRVQEASTSAQSQQLSIDKEKNEEITQEQADQDTYAMPKSDTFSIYQKQIKEYFHEMESYSSTGPKAAKITHAIIFMICRDNQPISIVENEGFKELLRQVAPHYKIPHRSTITRMLESKYHFLSELIKEQLSKIENITLTTDVWTDTMQGRSFLGVTAHFAEDTTLNSVILGVHQLEDRHTGEYLSQQLTNVCEKWVIQKENVTAVVTDNAANMFSAVELAFSKTEQLPCFAHTLNLVAEKSITAISEFEELIMKVKRIVTWFKQSVIANDELRKMTDTTTKLIQECPTRWNSKFYMIERFIQLHTKVNTILIHQPTAPAMVSAMEMSQLKESLEILRPLEAATREICCEKYLTTNLVIPIVHNLVGGVSSVNCEDPVAVALKKSVLDECTKRFGKIENVHFLALST
ncbi:hypothetical protein NQ314_006430 [Rhamnusium bicolor]|uniref:DUF659 domain-containing protein n=1 Tax=Rhamnusium bicolor TaxID=1586634 RepID=A0AAV8Z474_9CUCU|nr:hypothetical protein NQ314_006430 [Rhamnusium bicolor]